MKLRHLAETLVVTGALCLPALADEPVAMVRLTPQEITAHTLVPALPCR
jgi:hypothetical protein